MYMLAQSFFGLDSVIIIKTGQMLALRKSRRPTLKPAEWTIPARWPILKPAGWLGLKQAS